MASFSTSALVLRRADYSEYDRMVTLFAPEYGRIDAIARGCRKPKSPLLNACEPFVSGEFQIYQNGERCTIEQCRIGEAFFDLRTDYDRLVHGVYWLKLLETSVMPESPMPQLFLTTLHALAHLTYSDLPPELLTMAFEMHLMARLGCAPRMDACMRCGAPISGDARFDADRGGCVCLNCASADNAKSAVRPGPLPYLPPFVSNGARRIMMKLPRTDYDRVDLLVDHPEWHEAAALFRSYIDRRLSMRRFAPPLAE